MSLTLALLIGSFFGTIWLLYSLISRWGRHWPSRGVELIPVQSVPSRMISMDFGFIKQDVSMYQKLKSIGLKFGGYMELWNPILYIVDLDLIKNVLIKDFDNFSDHRGFATSEEPHMYLNLFNLTGEAWHDLRTKMTPAFTTGKMRRMFTIFDTSAQKMTQALARQLDTQKESSVIEIRPFLQNSTLDLISSAAFGVQSDIFDNPENSMFNQMGTKMLNTFTGTNILKLSVIMILPKVAKYFGMRLLAPEVDQFFTQIVTEVVKKRQQSGERREDFIQILLEAKASIEAAAAGGGKDGSKLDFSEDLLVAQCMVFILGGFDTVDALLSFAVYELAVNPEIQEKLYGDIKTAVEANGGQFSYDIVINELELLDQVVQETLRKYPPPIRLDRKVTRPYKVPDSDLVLPKDAFVVIPVYAIQHDPEIYPEPERFLPERFTKENISSRHSCAYMSFGGGPRNCIGNRFALAEAKYVIAHLVHNFKLEPSHLTMIPPVFTKGGALKPIDKLPLKITRRDNNTI